MLSEDRDRAICVTGICRLGGLCCRKMELELLVLTEYDDWKAQEMLESGKRINGGSHKKERE